jgi:hypothetical protein
MGDERAAPWPCSPQSTAWVSRDVSRPIPQWVLRGALPVFLAANCMLAVVGIVSEHTEYFWLPFASD